MLARAVGAVEEENETPYRVLLVLALVGLLACALLGASVLLWLLSSLNPGS